MRKRFAIWLVVIAFLGLFTSCAETSPELKDPTHVVKYDHFSYDDSGSKGATCHAQLHFTNPDGSHKMSTADYDCNDALRKLEWLDKGKCYTNPLSEGSHDEVACG